MPTGHDEYIYIYMGARNYIYIICIYIITCIYYICDLYIHTYIYIYIYIITRRIYIYYCRMRSENRHRAQSPTSIVPVACAGACAGAGVPRSVFLEPFGEHFAPFCMHGAPFSEHWAPASRLRSPGLAKCSILDDFRAKCVVPLGLPFRPKS